MDPKENETKPVEVVEETVPATEEEVVTEEETTEEEPVVDYDEELQAREATREHNKTNATKRIENKKSTEEEEPKEDIKEIMRSVIREETVANEASNAHDVLQDTLSKIDNASERRLTEDIYKNSIKSSGTSRAAIENDVQLARTLANQPKVKRENSELKIAAKNRTNMSNDGGVAGKKEAPAKKSQWTREQLADFKLRGVTPEQVEATQTKLANQ